MQNINNLSPADVEYTQVALKFVEKYKSYQDSETNCSNSHRKSRKIRLRSMEAGNKKDKKGKSCFKSCSTDKIMRVFDGAAKTDYDSSYNC